MRSFIVFAALAVMAVASGPGYAGEQDSHYGEITAKAFSEDGIYIPPGESAEITIAGDCRLLTNHDERIGFYITPSRHDAWPDAQDRTPLEPTMTEAPCK